MNTVITDVATNVQPFIDNSELTVWGWIVLIWLCLT